MNIGDLVGQRVLRSLFAEGEYVLIEFTGGGVLCLRELAAWEAEDGPCGVIYLPGLAPLQLLTAVAAGGAMVYRAQWNSPTMANGACVLGFGTEDVPVGMLGGVIDVARTCIPAPVAPPGGGG